MLKGSLFRKYAVAFAGLVTLALLVSGAIGVYFTYQENKRALLSLQLEKATTAASRIESYVLEIEHQIGWLGLPQPGADDPDKRRFDTLKLLRQVPAITDVSQLDRNGREQIRVSRLGMNVAKSGDDFSSDPKFTVPRFGRKYVSPVYFRKETEPYMTVAMAGMSDAAFITVAEVNLKFILDVVSRIQIGQKGFAYVVDSRGRLIAHPDISKVLQKLELGSLPQVKKALTAPSDSFEDRVGIARDGEGREVLAASAGIQSLGWHVLVEQPLGEAFETLYDSMKRTGLLVAFGLVLSTIAGMLLARRMVDPIQAIQAGAERIGAGTLDHPIEVHTGDELEALAGQVNNMAAQLKESVAGLERKVDERTRALSAQSAAAEAERHRAEAANLAKSAFLANMSHELRTPLNAVIGFAQLMDRDRSLPKDHREHLGIILRSGEHLLGLINDVLSLAKIEAGRVTLATASFELPRFLEGLTEMLAVRAEGKGLDLLYEPGNMPPRRVVGDESKLRQLLINLVGNAIKFTREGRVTLRTAWRDGRVVFEIEDTGPGMSRDELGRLFQPFVQTETGEKAKEGTGLGLVISRNFARLMGGDITVVSERGKGTTFTVTADLPLIGESDTVREIARERRVIRLEPGQPPFRMLVVDDVAENRILLAKLLESVGFEVRQAANGEQSVELWRSYEPHLIWMDMRMPVMDGMTATRTIRKAEDEKHPRVKIVALSASAFEHERDAVREAGCDDFLAKPFREPAVFEKLVEHLGARFEYEDAPSRDESVPPAGVLTAARLGALSPALRSSLLQALQIGDDEAASKLLAAIRSEDGPLGDALEAAITHFQVDELLSLLEKTEGRSAP